MRNKIVEEIFNSNLLSTLFKNMCVRGNDFEDLEQEILLILLEYDDDKIIEMYNNKQLKWFIIKLIKNQYFSVNSPYYKKYKKYYKLIDGNITNGGVDNELESDDE